MEILHIYRIWLHLCFQAESMAFMINMAILTLLILDKVTCIKLHTRAVGRNFHSNAGFLTVCTGNRTDITLCIIVCYIVMVITACKLQLLKISLNISADWFGNIKINCSSTIKSNKNRR